MTTTSSSKTAFAALVLVSAAAGCSSFVGDSDAPAPPENSPELPQRDNDNTPTGAETESTTAKAPPIGGPADTSELTNALGVFVAPTGLANAAGTREFPLASIQAAIDVAKRAGKRVYVCGGTYREALTIADSISVIGGLDCTAGDWRTGGKRARIESPSSPAIRANQLTSPTRLEGLDVAAPDANTPSSSSIGLIVSGSSALVIADSRIAAGNAAKGDDGTAGKQLTKQAGWGSAAVFTKLCTAGDNCIGMLSAPPAGAPTNQCDATHAGESGGAGGRGGLFENVADGPNHYFRYYMGNPLYGNTAGESRTGAVGANGADGSNGLTLGSASAEGYFPSAGTNGGDGMPGKGGRGGQGTGPSASVNANDVAAGLWRGTSGAGGGAGGCPGLAGTAGKGGGASIAALLINSPISFSQAELVSARGGDPGLGVFGSNPMMGGASGADWGVTGAQNGGSGGTAGISGNGSSGPSVGIMHVGAAPTIDSKSTIRPGSGGAPIAARTRAAAVTGGLAKTIPATPAGISKAILAL